MKQAKRAFAMFLCVATVLSLCMTFAVAGNVCSNEDIKGDGNTTVTFYITTQSKWKLTKDCVELEATKKGDFVSDTWTGGDKTDSIYGYYHVNVYKQSGDSWNYVSKSSREWKNSKNISIKKLEKDTTYKIVVEPYSLEEIGKTRPFWYSASNGGGIVGFSWGSLPQWTVSATSKGVMTCSK